MCAERLGAAGSVRVIEGLLETEYRISCDGDPPLEFAFTVTLDAKTLDRVRDKSVPLPEWTLLDKRSCRACTLDASEHEHCPAAVAVADLIEPFGEIVSFTAAKVSVATKERTVTMDTTVQRALRSLLGLYMATSGCPVLARFKPMARYHLPFATPEETLFRSAGAYLLAQYFIKQHGGDY